MVTTWDVDCGIAGYSRALRSALVDQGVEVDVVEIDRVEQRYRTKAELREGARDMARRTQGADLVHVQHEHGLFAGLYGYPASLRIFHTLLDGVDAPTAVTFHTEPWPFATPGKRGFDRIGDYGRQASWWALVHRHLKRPDRLVIAHTRNARRQLLDTGVPADRVRIVLQGVTDKPTPPPGSPDALAARERLGFAPNDVVLTCFGFVSHHKGLDVAAQALLDLPDRFKLLIVGGPHPHSRDEALDEVLEVLHDEPELRPRVTLTGRVDLDRLADLHAATDICLAPYRQYPRVASSAAITWALASGRPVVASHVPAFVELLDQSECVDLVASGAAHELAWAVERMAADPTRAATLVSRAREYVASAKWEVTAAEHVALYEELMS